MKSSAAYYVLVAGFALAFWLSDGGDRAPAPSPVPEAAPSAAGELRNYQQAKVRVTMYSLTTCGYCKAMRRELTARNIAFVEYFLDAEPERKDELTAKLRRAGYRPGSIGTPTMEVNGVLLPNNPSIGKVLKQLREG